MRALSLSFDSEEGEFGESVELAPEVPTCRMSGNPFKKVYGRFAHGLIGMEETHAQVE